MQKYPQLKGQKVNPWREKTAQTALKGNRSPGKWIEILHQIVLYHVDANRKVFLSSDSGIN